MLSTDDALTDTLVVTSVDGVTTTEVVIGIRGLDDVPPEVSAILTEDVAVNDDGNLVATDRISGVSGFIAETLTGAYGELTIDDRGTWTYTADNSQAAIQGLNTGESLTDTLTVTGGDGVTTVEVVITINGLGNDAPNEVSGTVTEDAAVNAAGNLMVTGIVTSNSSGAPGFMAETLTGEYGTLTIDGEGAWTYTADNSQPAIQGLSAGEPLTDTFIVTSDNGVTTTRLTITITGENDAPMAIDDPVATTNSGGVLADANLLLNDIDPDDDTLTVTAVNGAAANLGVATAGSGGGEFTVSADGAWSFDPGTHFDDLGDDTPATTSVTYTVSDGNGGMATATLTVTVTRDPALPVHVLLDTETTVISPVRAAEPAVAPTVASITAAITPVPRDLGPPELRSVDDIFAEADDNELITIINPVRLDSPLADLEVTGTTRLDISGLFGHISSDSSSAERLRFEAFQPGGEPLPDFVTFDVVTGTFLFNANAAAESGVASLQIRVVAIDPDGNQASDVFRVNFPNVDGSADDSADETSDATSDETPDETSDETSDAAPDAAPESLEQQDSGQPGSEISPDNSLDSDSEFLQDASLMKELETSVDVADAADLRKESLKEQVLRAAELGYQQGKLQLSLLLTKLLG